MNRLLEGRVSNVLSWARKGGKCMANKPDQQEPHDDHTHDIAGITVGGKAIPTSAIAVFVVVIFIALLSWIPTHGF
jgi:hypothetical protein